MGLELLEGGSLFDYIMQTGAFDDDMCRHYMMQLVAGMAHVHRLGYSHSDLKPENIMLSSDFVIKIIDFGLSKRT